MYLYLVPRGGFNDHLSRMHRSIEYCIQTKRTLLIDTTQSCYQINFSDYFYFKNLSIPVVTDINAITRILVNNNLTIHPHIKDRNIKHWNFKYTSSGICEFNGILLDLPPTTCRADIIVYSSCGGGYAINTFKHLFFTQPVIDHVRQEFKKLPAKYLCIHIRNTDRKCKYKELYENNKSIIHSYPTIYVATDDKDSIEFFKSKSLNIVNFTEFPTVYSTNLHYSDISGDTKIKNVITDIYIIAKADKLLSNSEGGFIKLARDIRNDIPMLLSKFHFLNVV